MSSRPPDELAEQHLLVRGWRHVMMGQLMVVLLILPMLRVHRWLTATAVAFSLVALGNTIRIHRSRARARATGQVPATTGRDLFTVAAWIVGMAIWAVAVAAWGRS